MAIDVPYEISTIALTSSVVSITSTTDLSLARFPHLGDQLCPLSSQHVSGTHIEKLSDLKHRVAIPHLHHPGGLPRQGGRYVWWSRDDHLPPSDVKSIEYIPLFSFSFFPPPTFATPHTMEVYKGSAVVDPIGPTVLGVAA